MDIRTEYIALQLICQVASQGAKLILSRQRLGNNEIFLAGNLSICKPPEKRLNRGKNKISAKNDKNESNSQGRRMK
jgi:hypothetical protein